MRSALLPVLVALLPVLAGCSAGDAGSDSGDAGGGAPGEPATGGGQGVGSGGEHSGSGGAGTDGGTGGAVQGTGGAASGTGGAAPGTGGGMGDDTCTPNPSGGLTVVGDVVVDETTCLSWMKGSISSEDAKDAVDDTYPGATMADAEAACEALELGGYGDWRIPTLGELSTIATRCAQWGEPPPLPWAVEFEETGPVWSSTPASDGKYCVVDASAGGTPSGSYSSGAGVRCVRGAGTAPSPTECSAESIPSCP